jgi:DNA replication and repair protein RecF
MIPLLAHRKVARATRAYMWLRHLSLFQYRNFDKLRLEFTQGAQLLTGVNGAGKTNLLEAIGLILSSHSFRTYRLNECVMIGKETACIQAVIVSREIEHHIELQLHAGSRRFLLNHKVCRDWAGLFPCVTWVPDDLELIRSGPAVRRKFLDHHLIQTDPLYSHHLLRYQRALEQRSKLLREGKIKGIEAFEMQMALSATYLMQARSSVLTLLSEQFKELVKQLGFEGEHHLIYEPCQNDFSYEALCGMWQKSREQELRAKQNMKGPHLEDFQVVFQSYDARKFASEGQARVCVAALKISEWKQLSSHENEALLLIDEVGMGLDSQRWQHVWKLLEGWQQVFLTSPHPSKGPHSDLWRVDQGRCWKL